MSRSSHDFGVAGDTGDIVEADLVRLISGCVGEEEGFPVA